jgi:hypothetical protein
MPIEMIVSNILKNPPSMGIEILLKALQLAVSFDCNASLA